LTTHGLTLRLDDRDPSVDPLAWIAPGAVIVGAVRIREHSSVWYGAVLRGDEEALEIGRGTNIQDNCVLHADPGFPLVLGDNVTVGHNATVHGARVGDATLIGMGAVLLNGCEIGEGCIVGAGAVVAERATIPPRSLVLGVPAKIRRSVTDEEYLANLTSAHRYVARVDRHRDARPVS
jgi:carbonic anhydrase/acetyltransferase-like protein (isoleucine patch superfamily)